MAINGRTWMGDTVALHGQKLRQICLPASHDSGTYALLDKMSPQYGDFVEEIVNLLETVAHSLAAVPYLNKIINPAEWVMTPANEALRGLTTATRRTVAQQLDDGIRCLDLRVCLFGSEFHIYHGLLGPRMTEVLDDIGAFLAATSGEIVYVTMGHFAGLGDADKARFATLVKEKLGHFAYVRQTDASGAITNDPFDRTYGDIIKQGGTARSRVVLVSPASTDAEFWPELYSPPQEKREQSVIVGKYTNTTDLDTMLRTQREQQVAAAPNLPFALYMTLTPSGGDYFGIVVTSLASSLAKLGAALLLIPFVGWMLSPAIEAIAAGLWIGGKLGLSWTTLEELSAPIERELAVLVRDNFAPADQPNNISFLYSDFYENSALVSVAISLSVANVPRQKQELEPQIVGLRRYARPPSAPTRYEYGVRMPIQGGNWKDEGEVFRALGAPQGGAIPIYRYQRYDSLQRDTAYRFGRDSTAPKPFDLDGIAFYAFDKASPGLLAFYELQRYDGSQVIYYYSAREPESGWQRNSTRPLFYALPPSLQPVWEMRATSGGVVRYAYVPYGAGSPGTEWSDPREAFMVSNGHHVEAVPVYRHSKSVAAGETAFRLSLSKTLDGYKSDGQSFFAFPEFMPGLAAIREFSQRDNKFGGLFRYAPALQLPGWTSGPIVFYAGLPDGYDPNAALDRAQDDPRRQKTASPLDIALIGALGLD